MISVSERSQVGNLPPRSAHGKKKSRRMLTTLTIKHSTHVEQHICKGTVLLSRLTNVAAQASRRVISSNLVTILERDRQSKQWWKIPCLAIPTQCVFVRQVKFLRSNNRIVEEYLSETSRLPRLSMLANISQSTLGVHEHCGRKTDWTDQLLRNSCSLAESYSHFLHGPDTTSQLLQKCSCVVVRSDLQLCLTQNTTCKWHFHCQL